MIIKVYFSRGTHPRFGPRETWRVAINALQEQGFADPQPGDTDDDFVNVIIDLGEGGAYTQEIKTRLEAAGAHVPMLPHLPHLREEATTP